jgi:heat shock protein HtpX
VAGPLIAVRNVLKAWLLLVLVCGALGLLGWWLGGYKLLSVFLFCGLLLGVAVYWTADRVVMAIVGARELPLGEGPIVHSTVERLAARAGIPKPRVYLINDGLPRALAVGRGARSAAIGVSAGLLSACPPAELDGVLAHELAHVKHRDVTIQTPVVVLAAWFVELSEIGGFLRRAVLFVLGPVAAAFVHLLLSPAREYAADRAAAYLCESPHGLADALVRLEQASELVAFAGSPATEPLYTFNPFLEEGVAALFSTHPPIAERVRRLRDLDPAWRAKLRAA